MENVTNPEDLEQDNIPQEPSEAKPNTENGDLEYTEKEVEFADGHGTLLDEEISDDAEDNQEE